MIPYAWAHWDLGMFSDLSLSLKRAARNAARQAIGPTIGACVVGYFVYYAVQGDRGLIAMKQLQAEIVRAETVLAQVTSERERMEHRANLLKSENLDPDMLDERARTLLNLASARDVVIPLQPLDDINLAAENTGKSAY